MRVVPPQRRLARPTHHHGETMTTDKTAADVRDFAAWLCEHDNGETVITASRALAECAQAAMGQAKRATLTLKVVIAPAGASGAAQVAVQISSALPQPEPAASIFFVDDHGVLTRHDPRQLTFDPRTGEVQ